MNVTTITRDGVEPGWLLLAASLPGRESSSARVRVWRALKDVGAASLRDGVTLLPLSATARERFAAIAAAIEADGGSAWTFEIQAQRPALERELRLLFDRAAGYRNLDSGIRGLGKELAALDEAAARRRFRELERGHEEIAALDFFPGASSKRTQTALDKLRAALDRRFSPKEPSPREGMVRRRSARAYKRALWATRKRLWVDRVASAWLIRHHIDGHAEFVWLDSPADCPKGAHGFDFDGAEFTHVGDRVTFEVLLESFALERDAGLAALGRLVHYLDVGGEPVAEAAGFEAVLAGLRDGSADDDALLEAATPVLDALYHHFATTAAAPRSR